ncbi:hypothetical protein Scel_01750 [Streptomyces cellostaticus]|nr:hypothetical protein Scel_01750 [Streptomyces cellostaticus]
MPLAQAQRVGQGVEKVSTALVERADDQTGHGFLRDACCVERSRSGQTWHARGTGRGEHWLMVDCMLASFRPSRAWHTR